MGAGIRIAGGIRRPRRHRLLDERLSAQLLAGPPAPDPLTVVERLLAVQAQDGRGARLAIRARTTGLHAADVDRALTQDRSLVVTWLNRGTLHLVRSEDLRWLHALTTPQLTAGNARRLEQEGVAPAAAERGVAVLQSVLAHGPLTRYQLRDHLAAAGVPVKGQALIHVLVLASLRRLVVRGPMLGIHHGYVLTRDWLGDAAADARTVDRERALAELARRYLAGHGPANERDLAKWAGITLANARAGLQAIADDLDMHADGLVDLAGRPPAAGPPPPRLLGSFEPLLLGWASRELLLEGHEHAIISGGLFRPMALVRGRAVGTWRLGAGRVVLQPFGRLASVDAAALEADGRDVVRYLGLRTARTPTPSPPAPSGGFTT